MPKLKTAVATRVKTRTALLIDTAQRFLSIAAQQGDDVEFFDKRLELMIRNQFLCDLTIVASKGRKPVGGVSITFDWAEHEKLSISYGDEVDMSCVPEGQTFDSIQAALDSAQRYLEGIRARGKADRFVTWYGINPVEEAKYGMSEIRRILDIYISPEDEARHLRDWSEIYAAKLRGREGRLVLAEASEAILGAFSL